MPHMLNEVLNKEFSRLKYRVLQKEVFNWPWNNFQEHYNTQLGFEVSYYLFKEQKFKPNLVVCFNQLT